MTDKWWKELLKAPDSQLDASTFPLIEKWSDPPTSLQILEVLDRCIYCSLASGFVVKYLQIQYDIACERENIRHEYNIPIAVWRRELGG